MWCLPAAAGSAVQREPAMLMFLMMSQGQPAFFVIQESWMLSVLH